MTTPSRRFQRAILETCMGASMRLSAAHSVQVFLTAIAISLVAEQGIAQISSRSNTETICESRLPGKCEPVSSSFEHGSDVDSRGPNGYAVSRAMVPGVHERVGFAPLEDVRRLGRAHFSLWRGRSLDVPVIRVRKPVDQCAGLTPTGAQNIQESFKGQIEGKLGGIVGKLTGGIATLEGEFKSISEDTLKNYPESHKLYVWQRLIYLACIDENSKIDINALAQAYLVGPSLFGSGSSVAETALDMEVIGFDTEATEDLLGHYKIRQSFNPVRIPNLIFTMKNSSSDTVSVFLDQCEFVNFELPRRISITFLDTQSFPPRHLSVSIDSLVGVARFKVPGHAVLRPGQKRTFSYGIWLLEALSFEGRQQSHSSCTFTYSSNRNAFAQRKQIAITSPKGVVSGR